MNTRIKQLIEHYGCSASQFAARLGWKPQYLANLLNGVSGVGIKPIITILQSCPEVNARWLLLGEGVMIERQFDAVKEHMRKLLELDKYVPVMNPVEKLELSRGNLDFPPETIANWEALLAEKNEAVEARFKAAYERQKR